MTPIELSLFIVLKLVRDHNYIIIIIRDTNMHVSRYFRDACAVFKAPVYKTCLRPMHIWGCDDGPIVSSKLLLCQSPDRAVTMQCTVSFIVFSAVLTTKRVNCAIICNVRVSIIWKGRRCGCLRDLKIMANISLNIFGGMLWASGLFVEKSGCS